MCAFECNKEFWFDEYLKNCIYMKNALIACGEIHNELRTILLSSIDKIDFSFYWKHLISNHMFMFVKNKSHVLFLLLKLYET